MKNSDQPTAPANARDWTTLYRAVVMVFSVAAGSGGLVFIYAGGTYVESKAGEVIKRSQLEDLPPRVHRLEEISKDRTRMMESIEAWRRQKDAIDTRLTAIIETQQRTLERQQTLIEQFTRRGN